MSARRGHRHRCACHFHGRRLCPGRDRRGQALRRVLQGTSGKDNIVGNAANNKIYGGRSADRLFGAAATT